MIESAKKLTSPQVKCSNTVRRGPVAQLVEPTWYTIRGLRPCVRRNQAGIKDFLQLDVPIKFNLVLT